MIAVVITQHVLRSKGIGSNFLRYCKRGTKIEFVSKYHHMSQNEFEVRGILITKPGYKENQMIGYEVRKCSSKVYQLISVCHSLIINKQFYRRSSFLTNNGISDCLRLSRFYLAHGNDFFMILLFTPQTPFIIHSIM